MKRKLIVSVTVLLLLMSIWVVFFYQLRIDEHPDIIAVPPGSTYTINPATYFEGRIENAKLIQISGPKKEIIQKNGKFSLTILKHERGLNYKFRLVVSNFVFTKELDISISTMFAGETRNIVSGSVQSCLQDQYGVFCWGRLSGLYHPPSKITGDGQLVAGSQIFCSLEVLHLICWGWTNVSETLVSPSLLGAGGSSVCVLDNRIIKCWGDRYITEEIPAVEHVQKITVGGQHACVLADSKVHCWGREHVFRHSPMPEFIYPQDIASGHFFNCVLDAGKMRCWGERSPEKNTPDLRNIETIIAKGDVICAKSENYWHCWSKRKRPVKLPAESDLELGHNSYCLVDQNRCFRWTGEELIMPRQLDKPMNIANVYKKICIQLQDEVICSEELEESSKRISGLELYSHSNTHECYYAGSLVCDRALMKVQTPVLHGKPSHLISGYLHSCVIVEGRLECWGIDGDLLDIPEMNNVVDYATGGESVPDGVKAKFSCAIHDNDKVSCWGRGRTKEKTPTKWIKPKRIAIGGTMACVIDGQEVKCWGSERETSGYNRYGDWSLVNPTEITVGYLGSVCVLDEGKVKCKGPGSESYGAPPIDLVNPAKLQFAGAGILCAIDDNGVTCWGNMFLRFPRIH